VKAIWGRIFHVEFKRSVAYGVRLTNREAIDDLGNDLVAAVGSRHPPAVFLPAREPRLSQDRLILDL
jgi:hypothetical protein